MGWSGGTYTKGNSATGGWTGDASLGIGIEAGRHDTQDNDFASGINNCLAKDGQNAMTGNLNLGSTNRIVNVASATARTDAPQVAQIQDGDFIWLGTTAGTATAQTATATPAITAYKAGQKFRMNTGFASTGSVATQHTLNINGIGAKDITNQDNTNLTAGSFVAGAILEVVYDGTRLKMINDAGGWQAFIPTLSGSGGMTIPAQTNAIAEYKKSGKTVTVVWDIAFTTAGVATNLVNSTAPVNSLYGLASSGQVLFGNPMVSSGATGTIGQMYFTTATNIAIYRDTQSAPANFSIGSNSLRVITTYRSV